MTDLILNKQSFSSLGVNLSVTMIIRKISFCCMYNVI